jgi:hypothetical protein
MAKGMDADEVGMRHGRYGEPLGIVTVTPTKPAPRWVLRLRALVRRRATTPKHGRSRQNSS